MRAVLAAAAAALILLATAAGAKDGVVERLTANKKSNLYPALAINDQKRTVAWFSDWDKTFNAYLLDFRAKKWRQQRVTGGGPACGVGPRRPVALNGATIYVAWYEAAAKGRAVRAGWSSDGGVTWSVARVSDGSEEDTNPAIFVRRDGAVVLAWERGPEGGRNIVMAGSWDGGRTWWTSPVDSARADDTHPVVAVAEDGAVHVAWARRMGFDTDVMHALSRDNGRTWAVHNVTPDTVREANPDLAVRGSTAFLAWEGTRLDCATDDCPTAVYVARSSDGGDTWERARVSDLELYRPSIALSGSSRVLLAAQQPLKSMEVIYGISLDDGRTWDLRQVTSSVGEDTNPAIAADAQGKVHLVWQGSETGSSELYYTQFWPKAGPLEIATPTPEPTGQPEPTPVPLPSVTVVPETTPTGSPPAPTFVPEPSLPPLPTIGPEPGPSPTAGPSARPSPSPTAAPTAVPTAVTTVVPSLAPSAVATAVPTELPGGVVSLVPTTVPTMVPTSAPPEATPEGEGMVPTLVPTLVPTELPGGEVTLVPSLVPSMVPALPSPSGATAAPTAAVTGRPAGGEGGLEGMATPQPRGGVGASVPSDPVAEEAAGRAASKGCEDVCEGMTTACADACADLLELERRAGSAEVQERLLVQMAVTGQRPPDLEGGLLEAWRAIAEGDVAGAREAVGRQRAVVDGIMSSELEVTTIAESEFVPQLEAEEVAVPSVLAMFDLTEVLAARGEAVGEATAASKALRTGMDVNVTGRVVEVEQVALAGGGSTVATVVTLSVENMKAEDVRDFCIVQLIPKAFAASVKDVTFKQDVRVVVADPVVLWSVDRLKGKRKVDLGFSVQRQAAQSALSDMRITFLKLPGERCKELMPREDAGASGGGAGLGGWRLPLGAAALLAVVAAALLMRRRRRPAPARPAYPAALYQQQSMAQAGYAYQPAEWQGAAQGSWQAQRPDRPA